MYEFQVDGMTCGGCVAGVRRAVQSVDAGAQVEVDLKNKLVRVQSEEAMDAVSAAIEKAGYPVLSQAANDER